ncbi:MAG: acetyl-CoA acetyltransferase [Halobacteriales archaeon]|jgi:acetyl-CoA acetyltransferase
MDPIRVAGGKSTKFGEYPERTGREMFAEASQGALEDAGIEPNDVDALYYGNFMGQDAENQGHQGPLMAESVATLDIPATRIESACASAGFAVAEGIKTIQSGRADVVLVGGMERMNNLKTEQTTASLATAADDLYEIREGMTFPGAYALMANAYFEEYGGSREDLAAIAVKNHENGANNPKAQFQFEITTEKVLDAPMVADPIGLFDACPITDGASAAVLTSEPYAEAHGLDAPVTISGSGRAVDNLALHDRPAIAQTKAAENAAESAYEEANITPEDVDLAEVHDCFTIAEVLALEGLKLFEPGEAISAATEGITTADGSLPVNLSGGLKAKGHPVGATGVSQVVEIAQLLDGTHPNSDAVPDATLGVTHNAGGTVASVSVHVLEVAE